MQKIYSLHEIQYFIQSLAITDDWFLVQKALQQMHLTLLLALRPMKIFQTPFKTVKNNSKGGGNPRRGTRKTSICGKRSCDEGGIWRMWTRKLEKSRAKKQWKKFFGYAHGSPTPSKSHHGLPDLDNGTLSDTWGEVYFTSNVCYINHYAC